MSLAKTRAYPHRYSSSLKVFAKYCAITGKNKKAEKYFTKSLAQFEKYPYRHEDAKAKYDYGIFLQNSGRIDQARSILEQAYRKFNEIGDQFYLEKIRFSLGIAKDDTMPVRNPLMQFHGHKKLYEIITLTAKLNSSTNFDAILEKILLLIIDITGAARGYILLKDSKQDLIIAAKHHVNEHQEMQFSRSLVHQVLETGKSVVTTITDDDRAVPAIESIVFCELKSILIHPILYQDKPVGVCYLDNPYIRGAFLNYDEDLIAILLDQLSIVYLIESKKTNNANTHNNELSETFCLQYHLSPREREIVTLLMNGYSRKDIAHKLSLTYSTVETYMKWLYKKTGMTNKSELIEYAKQNVGNVALHAVLPFDNQ